MSDTYSLISKVAWLKRFTASLSGTSSGHSNFIMSVHDGTREITS